MLLVRWCAAGASPAKGTRTPCSTHDNTNLLFGNMRCHTCKRARRRPAITGPVAATTGSGAPTPTRASLSREVSPMKLGVAVCASVLFDGRVMLSCRSLQPESLLDPAGGSPPRAARAAFTFRGSPRWPVFFRSCLPGTGAASCPRPPPPRGWAPVAGGACPSRLAPHPVVGGHWGQAAGRQARSRFLRFRCSCAA